jgi:hypothetical protein
MDLSGLPQFTVDARRQGEDGVVLTGHFSHLRGVRNDGGWLYRTDAPAIVGSLSRVPAAPGEPVEFRSPDDDMAAGLAAGETYPWVDHYWQAYHVTMILAGRWEPRRFVAEAAHYFRQGGVVGWQPVGGAIPEGAEDLGVREGAWDHEHCELCNAHIGGPGDPDGYVDPDERWLCRACYERYAVPRDVSFAAGA